MCAAVAKELQLPVVSGMYRESPGVDLYRKEVTIVETADSARGMGKAVPPWPPSCSSCSRARRSPILERPASSPRASARTCSMNSPARNALCRCSSRNSTAKRSAPNTPCLCSTALSPRPAIADISKATIAIVTSGGIVPFGNPDHIAASSAQNYGAYDLDGVTDLRKGEYMTAHGGYDQTYANADPDRVLPIDVLRDLEKEGKIGKLYHVFYSTVGNGTSVANARKFGTEIGSQLKAAHVDGVILTST